MNSSGPHSFFGISPVSQKRISSRLSVLHSHSIEKSNTKNKRHCMGDSFVTINKKKKLEHNVLVSSLSLPVQEALVRFRITSEIELDLLKKEGYNSSSSVSKLIDKMKTPEDYPTNSNCDNYTREDLDLVMELSGFNEEGALRALVLRDELAKLRGDGFNHPEAVDELSLRMKRLVGGKRRLGLSFSRSPTTARRVSKRLKRFNTMGEELLESTFPPSLSFEELVLPSHRKRAHEEGRREGEDFFSKRQLLDVLDFEAASTQPDEGNEVTLDEGIYFSSKAVLDGFGIHNPLSFEEYHDDSEEVGESFLEDPFSVNSLMHSPDEHNKYGVDVQDNTSTHIEEQLWQYTHVQTKQHKKDHRILYS